MLNNCIIMGRLTADPELRHTNSGVACCSFTLAVERDGKPNEQTGQRTADFIDCTAWRNTAEFICKWFSKGRMAVAAGRMQTRTWKDRHDQSRKSTELQVESMYFADSRKDAAADVPLADDDLPGAWTELSGSEPLPFLLREDEGRWSRKSLCCAKERGEHGTAAGRMCGQDGGFAACWRRFVFCFCWASSVVWRTEPWRSASARCA